MLMLSIIGAAGFGVAGALHPMAQLEAQAAAAAAVGGAGAGAARACGEPPLDGFDPDPAPTSGGDGGDVSGAIDGWDPEAIQAGLERDDLLFGLERAFEDLEHESKMAFIRNIRV